MKTWKIIKWTNRPEKLGSLELECPGCKTEASLLCGIDLKHRTIAAIGLRLILDPPGWQPPRGSLPDVIKCRYCRRNFSG